MRFSAGRFVSLWTVMALGVAVYAPAEPTTVYVVRHADCPPTGPDDDRLTLDGMRRANELQRILRNAGLSAVYSTKTIRTMQTATPAAVAAGVNIKPYTDSSELSELQSWADRLKGQHAGESILIVGHGHTVSKIIVAFGGAETWPRGFGDLFVLTIENGKTHVDARRYEVIYGLDSVAFCCDVSGAHDLSAIASTKDGSLVLVASDELNVHDWNVVDVFKPAGDGYKRIQTLKLSPKDEMDIEGIARHGDGNVFFVVGSHSYRRKNIYNRTRTYKKNRQRFEDEFA